MHKPTGTDPEQPPTSGGEPLAGEPGKPPGEADKADEPPCTTYEPV